MRLVYALPLLLAACRPPPAGEPPPAANHPPPPAGGLPAPPDEPGIVRALRAEHELNRDKIAALGGYGPAAFPLYHRLLDRADDAPWPACRTLVILADPKMKGDRGPFVDRAAAFLPHRHPSIRDTAVGLIGAVGGPADAAPVVGLLWDEDRSIVWAAAKALAAIGDRRTVAAIEVWLKRGNHREDDDIRRRVENCQADLIDRLKKEAEKAQAPPAAGPPAPPPAPEPLAPPDEQGILRELQNEHHLDRGKIAALGGYGPAAFPLYHRLLDRADDAPWPACRTLVILADPKMAGDRGPFVDRAVAFMAHRDPSMRRTAVELVGAVGGPGDAAPVVGLLWDEDLSTVLPAARALAAVGDRRTVAAMEVWLKRGNHRDAEILRRVENFQTDLVERLKKEEGQKTKKSDK